MKIRLSHYRAVVGYLLLGLSLPIIFSFLGSADKIGAATLFSLGDVPLAKMSNAAGVYAVSPDILAVEIAAPAVEKGQQMPYQPQDGDELIERAGRASNTETVVTRAGAPLGTLIGKNKDILFTYDTVEPTTFPKRLADRPNSYRISSAADPAYTATLTPLEVFRKTKPAAFASQSDGYRWPARHTLFLKLPASLTPGNTYSLSFPGLGIGDADFSYEPSTSPSEAVHVSQLGFAPDDPLKVGYLSTWMGSGGSLDYPEGLGFELIDERTNQAVYTGTASLSKAQQQAEDPRGQDYTLTEVHKLDFSEVTQPGEYRLCVQAVGCSLSFKIDPQVWDRAFATSAKGFYHQRSGIEIGAPHSSFSRPRAFHPEDGVQVYQAGATLQEVDMGLGDRDTFEALNSTKTETLVPDAWGGYFDAGDWDRRTQHLSVPRRLLELHNLFPDYFKSVDLDIPESANALPDVIDEALWSLDFFRRLQTPEGGIRGGIQSAAEGGIYGEASWQESLDVMAYAPDEWSSYTYAGVAARAAYTLLPYDATLAATYRESALKAMAFAENNYQSGAYDSGQLHHVKDQRNLSSLELYRLTGDEQWHELFLSTTVFQDPTAEASIFDAHEQRDAAFLYARLSDAPTASTTQAASSLAVDAQVQANARNSLLRYADSLVALTNTTAFGWSKTHPRAPLGWDNGLGAPKGITLLQAHALTQDRKYLVAGLSSTQFSGGANPDNLSYTTGLGDRTPQNPLIIDQRVTLQDPPPGITVYGPADLSVYSNYWTMAEIADETFPQPEAWPAVENYFDIYLYPMGTEFTVDSLTHPAYTWGYLAASDR